MLEAVGGSRPVEHDALLQSLDYVAERQKGNRLPAYLQYLADTSSAPTPYSEQVRPVSGQRPDGRML